MGRALRPPPRARAMRRGKTAGRKVAALGIGLCSAALVVACGGGGNRGSGAVGSTGNLVVRQHAPAAAATQVPLDTRITVQLDGVVVAASLNDPATGLATASGLPVPGALAVAAGGSTVVFAPTALLAAQTDYVFSLSALTADVQGRILDRAFRLAFRTIDVRPPAIAAASIAAGQSEVARTGELRITFDEDLDPTSATAATVRLEDASGAAVLADLAVSGSALRIQPAADLRGDADYRLLLAGGGLRDLAGNALSTPWIAPFRTEPDVLAPALASVWPAAAAASPLASPEATFAEAMDAEAARAGAFTLADDSGAPVPFTVAATRDQRTLRLVPTAPLVRGRSYRAAATAGATAAADVSGNELAAPFTWLFAVGTDASPPTLAASTPAAGALDVALHARPLLRFDEDIDPSHLSAATVSLLADGSPWPASATVEGGDALRVAPAQPLPAGASCTLTVRGGIDGVRDLAGNPLAADLQLSFRVTVDATVPDVVLAPTDGHSAVPANARLAAVFDSPVEPATVNGNTFYVADATGQLVAGTIALTRGDRVVHFEPMWPWRAGEWYTLTVLGGDFGVHEATGNHLLGDRTSRFRAGYAADATPPSVFATLNGVDQLLQQHMSVPPFGFAIDVSAHDAERLLDPGSLVVELSGPAAPSSAAIFDAAAVTATGLSAWLPPALQLAPGDYALTARAADLAGNEATAAAVAFQVRDADAGTLPFERTQLVWVRFDLDRDASGTADFDEDLLRLGLLSAGDPAGTNARLLAIVQDGVLARAHALFGRDVAGDPLGPDSVPLRLTARQPLGVVHAEIACGGLDPEGQPGRSYGEPSSGTIGRAWFDYRNGIADDRNTGTQPGLGVFPGELFLFEARVHVQVYPAFLTSFARAFLPLCPPMGGTSAGAHPLDGIVLAPSFEETTATNPERVRYRAIFDAADDWATAVGIILAHEVGHSVGLVAEGPSPLGLHGDASLHNAFGSAAEVMTSAVGYDSLVTFGYAFHDLNLAYLRQRLLLK